MTTVVLLWWIFGLLLVGAGEWMRQKARIQALQKALLALQLQKALMQFGDDLSKWKAAIQRTDARLAEFEAKLRSSKALE